LLWCKFKGHSVGSSAGVSTGRLTLNASVFARHATA
jgi:hypothetical protein